MSSQCLTTHNKKVGVNSLPCEHFHAPMLGRVTTFLLLLLSFVPMTDFFLGLLSAPTKGIFKKVLFATKNVKKNTG